MAITSLKLAYILDMIASVAYACVGRRHRRGLVRVRVIAQLHCSEQCNWAIGKMGDIVLAYAALAAFCRKTTVAHTMNQQEFNPDPGTFAIAAETIARTQGNLLHLAGSVILS